jgi:hypothetical protein
MELSRTEMEGLGVALNEATLLGLEFTAKARVARVLLAVLTLPEEGPPPEDRRVALILQPVGRIAASLRRGIWNDETAPVVPFEIGELSEIVRQHSGCAIYGWEFFDRPEEDDFETWSDRLSINWRSGADGFSHSLDLFQEAGIRGHLDLRIWFDEMEIRDATGRVVEPAEFVAAGRRWWDAFSVDDPRTQGYGIIRAGPAS